MSQPQVILYDIIINSQSGKRQAGSPNTWKTRLALNYKSIPYKTVWVEYADIQTVCKSIGATASEKRPNGEARYTLPTIVVLATGAVISDSANIINFLEQHYPEKPLIPVGKVAEQLGYEGQLLSVIGQDLPLVITYRAYHAMLPASGAAMERVVHDVFGMPPFSVLPPPNAENLKRVEQGFSVLAAQYNGNKYIFGDQLTYADLIIAAYLTPLHRVLTDDERVQFKTWDNGKWVNMVEDFEAAGYLAEDEGELFTA